MTLTKAQIVDAIPHAVGLSRTRSAEIVETLIDIVKQRLGSGEDVLVSGFGKFCVRDKGARRGRNPATGDSMVLKERRVVVFRCSKILREKVNGQ